MRKRPVEPLALHLPAEDIGNGLPNGRMPANAAMLAAARHEFLAQRPAADERHPLVAAHLLAEYHGSGRGIRNSRLGQILARAKRLNTTDHVDAVVLVAGSDTCLAAKALLTSCAHPHHNELSRADRGGYPRIYLAPGPADNDALAALVDVVQPQRRSGTVGGWAIVSVDDGTAETKIKTRALAQALVEQLGQRSEERLLTVPGSTATCSPFKPAVLLAATLAGIDVVGLLAGAAATCERFAAEEPEESAALQLAWLARLAGRHPAACRVRAWSQALEPVGRWYARLREQALALGPAGDLHQQQPAEKIAGRPLSLNVVSNRLRRDRLDDKLPDVLADACRAGMAADRQAGCAVAELRLPRVDEPSVGQLMQTLMLAVAVEARLPASQNARTVHAND